MPYTDTDELFAPVEDALHNALLVAWDGCHKIYLAMDEHEADWFREEYPHTVEGRYEEMLNALRAWWDESCFLRFISAVSFTPENPNDGFVSLIEQFADEDDEDEPENDEDDDL